MRNNLLSLQNVSRLLDIASNRLATGLKVNSAIDNPSSFYTAQSLADRASDLNALLDSMSQGIQALKNASDALTAGTQFLQQAKAVAGQALEKAQPLIAKVNTEAELLTAVNSGKQGLIVINSNIVMSENSSLVLKDGQSLVGARYLDKNATQTKLSFNFTVDAPTAISVKSNAIISDLNIDFNRTITTNEAAVIYAENQVNLTYRNLNVKVNAPSTNVFYKGEIKTKGYMNINTLGSSVMRENTVNIFRVDRLDSFDSQININMAGNGAAFSSGNNNFHGNTVLNIKTNGIWSLGFDWGSASFFDNTKVNFSSTTSFSPLAAHINFNILSSNVLINALTTNTAVFANYGLGPQHDPILNAVPGATIMTSEGTYVTMDTIEGLHLTGSQLPAAYFSEDVTQKATLSAAFQNIFNNFDRYMENSRYEEEATVNNTYLELLNQYNSLVSDSSYKGINLLKNDSLKINFNEDRSSGLTITGVNASAEFLGLSTLDWKTSADIEQSIGELDNAVNKLRSYASAFGNYYNIVSTREDFTENLINVLTEGADKLTLADINQESANMLALQTRQQLAVNSLSLANQAAQSILKLF